MSADEARRRELGPFRGIAWAFLICAPLWALAFIVAVLVTK